jgi:hypothetical protein
LKKELAKKRNFKSLKNIKDKSFLSIEILQEIGRLTENSAKDIAAYYKTIGVFCNAKSVEVASESRVGKGTIEDAQNYIANHFKINI